MEPWEAGSTGRWEPILAWSLVGLPGFSRHVSSPGAAATHTVGSMSATGAARKRGKPASGAGAGAGAGKLRRKVSMALWRAGVHPAMLLGPPSSPSGGPGPGPLAPGTAAGVSFVPFSARQILKAFHLSRGLPPFPVALEGP